VLRAFAAHPTYKAKPEVRQAANLVISNFFKKDNYPDRSAPSFWFGVSYPFWMNDIVSSLDAISKLGSSSDDKLIHAALDLLGQRQLPDGSFGLHILRGRDKFLDQWIALSVMRIYKRFGFFK